MLGGRGANLKQRISTSLSISALSRPLFSSPCPTHSVRNGIKRIGGAYGMPSKAWRQVWSARLRGEHAQISGSAPFRKAPTASACFLAATQRVVGWSREYCPASRVRSVQGPVKMGKGSAVQSQGPGVCRLESRVKGRQSRYGRGVGGGAVCDGAPVLACVLFACPVLSL